MTDKLFVRFGLLFIILSPHLIYQLDKEDQKRYWSDGTKIDGYSVGQREAAAWRNGTNSRQTKTAAQRVENECRKYRNMLLGSVATPERLQLAKIDKVYLAWLVSDLERRPPSLRYDLDCIRLLGVVKNYLKSLDSADSDGILQVLPEQTTTPRDKSC